MFHIYDYNHLSDHLVVESNDVVVSIEEKGQNSWNLKKYVGNFVRVDTASGHYYYGLVTKQTPYELCLAITQGNTCCSHTRKAVIQKSEIVAIIFKEPSC